MIGRNIYKIFASNVHNPTISHCQRKAFIRKSNFQDIKFHCCFLKMCSLFVSNAAKSNYLKFTFLPRSKAFVFQRNDILQVFKCGVAKIPLSLKEHSVQVVKMCTRQCEYVVAHRMRRGQQMFSLYTKMWDEIALKNLIAKFRKQFVRRGKELLLSAVGVSVCNWEKMRISDNEMNSFLEEIDNVYHIRDTTITCQECHKRVVFDMKVPNIDYCACNNSSPQRSSSADQDWIPFLERKDTIVWRKEHPECGGLYEYKVYASYDDVTALDFLCVQLDTEYRKEWDRTAVELTILDSDPSSNSNIIYWVMRWPRMFSNRDYVYNRRFKIDKREKVMVVVNKCIEHPQCPERCENIRVKKYWSSMVIKPYKEFDEPGIEYCLTYFDDPGVSIPSAITSWVAVSGLPDFLARLREAARQLAVRRKCSKYNWIPLPEPEPETESETVPEEPKPTDLPSDVTPRVSLTSSHAPLQEPHDSYLQLSTARLFL